jgi:ABC-type molybdate transport system ATPase subunit
LNIGKVTIEQSVSSIFNDPKLENQSKNDLQQFIKYTLSTRSNLPIIFVTHQVNIEAFTNQFVLSGGILLVEVDNNGKYLTHKELIQ